MPKYYLQLTITSFFASRCVMLDFSVVICTFNGEDKLPGVLDRLRRQRQVSGLQWEVLVIDNNSVDNTAQVVRQHQSQWSGKIVLRSCFEPKQGLAHARRCALHQVKAPLIGFLDDDTLPNPTWVYDAWLFGCQHPQAGAYGSAVQPIYDVPPPPNFRQIASLLAIIDRGNQPFIYTHRRGVLPAGAGMVVRREAWLAHVPAQPVLMGVTARSLRNKGEDVETLSYIRDAGWEIWHNPAMKIQHHIPAERLEKPYLLKLCRSVGLNRFPLRMLRYRPWQRPLILPMYVLSDLRRLALYLVRNYRALPQDTVCACQLMLLGSSFMSPFYHWFEHLMSWCRAAFTPLVSPEQSSSQ